MHRIFFDASALIKRYSQETGTSLLNHAFAKLPVSNLTCSTLGLVEIIATLVRKRNDGRLSRVLFDQALAELKAELIDNDQFLTTPVNDELLLTSLPLIAKHSLNATDAVILRSALNLSQSLAVVGDDTALWTSDKRLARAAQTEGITVFDPELDTITRLEQLLQPKEPSEEPASEL